MRTQNPRAKKLVKFIRKECKRLGIKVYLVNAKILRLGGGDSVGYFDSERKMLKVATKTEEFVWLSTLAHEFAHAVQWSHAKDGIRSKAGEVWRAQEEDSVGHWLDKRIDLPRKVLREQMMRLMWLEHNAEVNAIRLLRRFNILNKEQLTYVTKYAALYVYAHHVALRKKGWGYVTLKKLLADYRVWDLLPGDLRQERFRRLPRKLGALIEELGYGR